MCVIHGILCMIFAVLLAAFYIVFLSAGVMLIRRVQNQTGARLLSVETAIRIFLITIPSAAALAATAYYLMEGKYRCAWAVAVFSVLMISMLRQIGGNMGSEGHRLIARRLFFCDQLPLGDLVKNFYRRYKEARCMEQRTLLESFYFTAEYCSRIGRRGQEVNLLVQRE